MKRTLGIDVSSHNGKVDWEKVKNSGKDFAFIRIGYSGYMGEIHLDRRFFENLVGAKNAGINVGLYVYSYNKTEESAKKTAREIRNILGNNHINMPVAFDIEETSHSIFINKSRKENSLLCKAFLDEAKNLGYIPLVYSYTAFIKNHLDTDLLKDYDLWVADYRDPSGQNCPYEGECAFWQYKGQEGRCDGVEGPCDLNIGFKTYESINYKEKYESLLEDLKNLIENF